MGGGLLEGSTMVGRTLDWKEELGRWLKPFLDRLGHKARTQDVGREKILSRQPAGKDGPAHRGGHYQGAMDLARVVTATGAFPCTQLMTEQTSRLRVGREVCADSDTQCISRNSTTDCTWL